MDFFECPFSQKYENVTKKQPNPVDTGRKLNVHKTFKRRPGRLLNVLCAFSLCPVSTGKTFFTMSMNHL